VSTKFLSNYMAWYKWLESFNDDKEIIRTKNMLIHSVIPFIDTKIKGYKCKIAEFI
ncbi:MAG: IS1595 family transposase, partial [Romboutsia timonensis]|nr:IS1595 family transposase [Romboutsia timonensis]